MDKTNPHNSEQSPHQKTKIIKRYGNRKLYDTEQSSYVVLNDIAKMIRNQENVRVIDNETKDDITLSTLTQIIFGAEKKTTVSAPLDILKSIIKEGDGSFSSFLAKIGLFNAQDNQKTDGKNPYYKTFSSHEKNKKTDTQSIGEKVASMVKNMEKGESEGTSIPHLPGNSLNNR